MALIEFKNLPDTSTPLNAENLNHNFNELKEDKEWKLLEDNVTSDTQINLPNDYNELYIEILINQANDLVNFYIPKIALSSSEKHYRNGFYFNDTVNGAVLLLISLEKIKYMDSFSASDVTSDISKMAIWYR